MNAVNSSFSESPDGFEDAGGVAQENLAVSEIAVSEIAVSEVAVSEIAVSEVAVSEIAIAEAERATAALNSELRSASVARSPDHLPDQPPDQSEPDAKRNPEFTLRSSFQSRYLMTQIGQQQLAFPLQWVSELILVEQSHILPLPFYDPMLLGVLQYKGDVVPLIVPPLASKAETAAAAQRLKLERTATAVRLNRAAGKLAGIGLIVDRVVERFATAPIALQPDASSTASTELPPQVRVFQLEEIPSEIWQPRQAGAATDIPVV